MTDEELVWQEMKEKHPEFLPEYAPNEHHAVREIVLGGSIGWAGLHARFKPLPGAEVMDLGANAGIFSIFCALHGAYVTAVEPHPYYVSRFNGFKLNFTPAIKLVDAAVAKENGLRGFVPHATNGGIQTDGVNWGDLDRERCFMARCVTLDELIGNAEWDCVKMDIEGAEFEVLLATYPNRLRRIKFMYIEFHPWASFDIYRKTMEKLDQCFNLESAYPDENGRCGAAYCTRRS